MPGKPKILPIKFTFLSNRFVIRILASKEQSNYVKKYNLLTEITLESRKVLKIFKQKPQQQPSS